MRRSDFGSTGRPSRPARDRRSRRASPPKAATSATQAPRRRSPAPPCGDRACFERFPGTAPQACVVRSHGARRPRSPVSQSRTESDPGIASRLRPTASRLLPHTPPVPARLLNSYRPLPAVVDGAVRLFQPDPPPQHLPHVPQHRAAESVPPSEQSPSAHPARSPSVRRNRLPQSASRRSRPFSIHQAIDDKLLAPVRERRLVRVDDPRYPSRRVVTHRGTRACRSARADGASCERGRPDCSIPLLRSRCDLRCPGAGRATPVQRDPIRWK